jgi:hypothetical protein
MSNSARPDASNSSADNPQIQQDVKGDRPLPQTTQNEAENRASETGDRMYKIFLELFRARFAKGVRSQSITSRKTMR